MYTETWLLFPPYYLLVKSLNIDKMNTVPARIQRTDPDQPMNSAAPNSYLRRNRLVNFKLSVTSNDLMSQHVFHLMSNDQEHTFDPQTWGHKIQTWRCGHIASRQSKSRDLKLQKFGLPEKSFNSSSQHSTDTGDSKNILHTTNKILESRKACNPGFELITSSDFGTLHSNQSTCSCKETKNHGCDHQGSAHLDVTYHKKILIKKKKLP